MILACKLAYVSSQRQGQDSQVPQTAEDRSSTPKPLFGLPLKIYPEMDLSVEIEDRRKAPDSIRYRVRVNGKADWVFGHDCRKSMEAGAVLIAVGAKTEDSYSHTYSQLLTYLAIIRKLRQQDGKTNVLVH